MSADPVGSLAEEAAKLMATVQGWAQDQTHPAGANGSDHGGADHAEGQSGIHNHADQATECRYCPICQLMRYARATSPEVRDHLANAALSMVLAIKGLMESQTDEAGRADPVEKIDLAED